jgi:hypothetical protein
LALHIAHEKLGIGRVLVTCDDDNIGSIRTIENNRGVLEDVISGPDLDRPKRRYWIDAGAVDRMSEIATIAGDFKGADRPINLPNGADPTNHADSES